jgi:hypothetical protein
VNASRIAFAGVERQLEQDVLGVGSLWSTTVARQCRVVLNDHASEENRLNGLSDQ